VALTTRRRFKELEMEIAQNDLDLETAEQAVFHYLEKLDGAAAGGLRVVPAHRHGRSGRR
jgi:hypothetical protein